MATVLILTLLMAMIPSTTAYVPGAVMYAPPLTVPATVDGVWSPGEWNDAPQYIMTGLGGTSYIRAKFNSTHLLVVIDSPWDTTPSTLYYHENVWLAFDTLNDGGGAPQADDFLVHATTSWTTMGWVGTGTGWNQTWLGWAGTFACVQAGENFGWGVPLGASPNSATPHRIIEMAVPLALVGYPGSTVGFYAQVDDDSTDPDGYGPLPATAYAEWPPGSGGSPGWPGGWGSAPCPTPDAWGDLKLYGPVGIPGDINHNGIVNIVDVVIAAMAFGSMPGDNNWNPDANLNNDGIINIIDLVVVGINFGRTS
jgi:hypothetical protein